ncbi:MAG: metallophosphoesterase family protein, partial [bacterium]
MPRVVALGDAHLGRQYHARTTPEGTNQREADFEASFEAAVDLGLSLGPDVFVWLGDVFDQPRPGYRAFRVAQRALRRIRDHGIPLVAISGNHDTPRSVETGNVLRLFDLLGIHAVSEQARWLKFEQLGCAVLAVPHQALVSGAPPPLVAEPDPACPIPILVIHGEVEGLFPDRDALELGGAYLKHDYLDPGIWTYVALGHY